MALKVVVIGAVALGPKAACRLKRLRQDAEIVMVDQDRFISYGGCGIPYYLSEDVPDETALMSTSFHMVRDERFFREAKGVRVMTRTRALRIDRDSKQVEVEDLDSGVRSLLAYDKLIIGTGSRNVVPPIEGVDAKNVYHVSNLQNALDVKQTVIREDIKRAVVIGGGAIGIEVSEALADMWGVDTTVVERLDHIFPRLFDENIARMAEHHLRGQGVQVYTGETVLRLESDGEGRVARVVTDKRALDADLVILAAGVRPNAELAGRAGIELGAGGGIVVNEHLQTSDPDIYAGGDCVENNNLLTGGRLYAPLGSLANRHGRVIGSHIAGQNARFEGVVGSFIVKIFDRCFAAAGLSQAAAREAGIEAERVLGVGYDRAHFFPEKGLMFLQLIVDPSNRRVLGIQGVGKANDAVSVRIDAVAGLLKHAPTVEDISNLELAYSPPFSSAMDTLNALGNTADNLLDGVYRRITVDEAMKLFDESPDVLFLDLNAPRAAQPYVERFPDKWMNVPYDTVIARIDEIPRDRFLITICDSGIRSYESQVILADRGFDRVFAMEGGLNALKWLGLNPLDR